MTSVSTLKTYIANGYNLLLQGDHGVGKTQMLIQACEELGWTLGYYSASTLDPYTDLVGIPYVKVLTDDSRILLNVRPHLLDEIDVLMLDELNRAEDKTLNALFEIVQFRRINNEPLPKLKSVIGAQNPPGSDYAVNSLDPAMVDRFHMVIDIKGKPDQSYLSGKLGADVAAAIMDWYRERTSGAPYISPRRLEMIGNIWKATPTRDAIRDAMPPGALFDSNRLFELLKQASGKSSVAVDYEQADEAYIRTQAMPSAVAAWMDGKTDEQRAHITKSLSELVGVDVLMEKWEPVMEVLTKDELSAMVAGWGPSKRSNTRKKAKQIKNTNQELAEKVLDVLATAKPVTV